MAINEMDARLISQGSEITTLTDGSLISVSEGAGQPQKNIQFANLVSEIHGEDSKLAKANTMEYVRALDASGNPILISKADLSSVIAGQMDVNKLFPFMYVDSVGIYGNIKDFNKATTSGYYKISGFDETVINKPLTGGYGDLVVHNANGYISQVYYGHYGNTLSFRTYDGKKWSDWVRTDNFGYNSLADLSQGVLSSLSKSYVNNLNDELTNGSCGMYSNDTTNRPPTTDTYGVWYTHKATYASGSGLFLIQVAMPQAGTEVWMRICWNNNWKDWLKIKE